MLSSLLLTGLLSAGAGLPAAAQEPAPGGVIGRVFDERTNEVLTDVLVYLDGTRREVNLSNQGRFVITGLPPGAHRLEVRAIGYRPYVLEVSLRAGQMAEHRFPMVFTGDRLPDVAVESRHSKLLPRFADFERRRQTGFGHFITRDEIQARGYMSMGDALRTVKGVRVDCGALDCLIRMARSTPQCFPSFWIDGTLARSFASTTPISDVQGIEVYRGPSDAPGEFAGTTAGCGVIVIWTRAAP
ncbi:MAG: carboxypeptidase regulatory-like domain-containing protein [Gemmatimonadales bacterium]